LINYYFGN